MPIGNVSSKLSILTDPRTTGLRFSRDTVVMSLEDGREISIPLRLYPTRQNARPAQRKSFELIGDGRAFRWEELDLDLSVDGLLHGLAERIPVPPPAPRKRGNERR